MQGRSQDFSKGGGGGGHTVSNIIVMAFSPRNIVGCFLKKGLQRGGHGHPRTPSRYALDECTLLKLSGICTTLQRPFNFPSLFGHCIGIDKHYINMPNKDGQLNGRLNMVHYIPVKLSSLFLLPVRETRVVRTLLKK